VTASSDGTARIWHTAPWDPDAWLDPIGRAQLIPLALRRAAKVTTEEALKRDTPAFEAAFERLKGLANLVRSSAFDEHEMAWVADRGLFIQHAETLVELGARSAQDGDVI